MIRYTKEGAFPTSEQANKTIESVQDRLNDLIQNHDAKITIRQFYKDFLGLDLRRAMFTELEGECFVDPDEWGWDKKGFRQLYRFKIVREEL